MCLNIFNYLINFLRPSGNCFNTSIFGIYIFYNLQYITNAFITFGDSFLSLYCHSSVILNMAGLTMLFHFHYMGFLRDRKRRLTLEPCQTANKVGKWSNKVLYREDCIKVRIEILQWHFKVCELFKIVSISYKYDPKVIEFHASLKTKLNK